MKHRKENNDSHELQHNMKQHKCTQCVRYEAMLQKYKNLVDLLNRKISQLTRKPKTQIFNHLDQEDQKIRKEKIAKTQAIVLAESLSLSDQLKSVSFPTLQETDNKPPNLQIKEKKQGWGTESQNFWKTGNLINTLTQEIMQLKSTFMHVRQCVYSLFQEANIWPHISKTSTGVNMTLVLFNIFQFSEQEREEMCRLRKVKAKKMQGESKENIFVTLKQI